MSSKITQSVGFVDSAEMLDKLMEVVAADQVKFSKFTQEQVDRIFSAGAIAATQARVSLAQLAVEEGGMGLVEDKSQKNHFSAEYVHNTYKDMKTCGVVERDEAGGFVKYAEPIGVLAGVVPCTNPTSTTIFKSLLALKTRNCIVFSPHPRTAKCTIEAAKIVRDAAVAEGAPANCIAWIDTPTIDLCGVLMKHPRVEMIVATGAGAMVKAAYSSGKPAFGGGSGNTPVIIDETANIPLSVNSVILSKTFDHGMICASEQGVIAVESVAEKVKEEFRLRGAYFLSEAEKDQLADVILTDKLALNPAAVGQSACRLAELAGIDNAPPKCRLLIGEIKEIGPNEKLSHEKLCPCLSFLTVPDFDVALQKGLEMVEYGGMGHTSVLYTNLDGPLKSERVTKFQNTMPTGRTLVCMPTSQGAIGNLFNFRQTPSMSLGCGSWGSNMTAESLQAKHLLNYKQVCERREHILWFRVPRSIFINRATITEAFRELEGDGLRRAFIVTDPGLYEIGHVKQVVEALRACQIESDIFVDVPSVPDMQTITQGVARMNFYNPDIIVALGGGPPMSAAKVMRLVYEHPEVSLDKLVTRFLDVQKRIVKFPEPGQRVKRLVCIPTTSGSGAEMTPFAAVYNKETKMSYPLADYSLIPDMAIIDANFTLTMSKHLVAEGGIGALVNALESHVSMLATDYTRGLSQRAIHLLFNNLEKSVKGNAQARENCHNAASIAAMAFGNSFVGICNSMAHQLTGEFGIPHGVACSLLICQTIKFNAEEAPSKQGTFPQYTRPMAQEHYAELADSMCLTKLDAAPEEKIEALVERIQRLNDALNMPRRIKDIVDVDEGAFLARLDDLTLSAFDDQCTGSNPRYPLIRELRQIMLDSYWGRTRKLSTPGLSTPGLVNGQ